MSQIVPASETLSNDPELLIDFVARQIGHYFTIASTKHIVKYDDNKLVIDQFSDSPITLKELDDVLLNQVYRKAVYKGSPEYLAYVDIGLNVANILASPAVTLLNQNMTTQVTDSPQATINEVSLLLKIRELAGYPVVRSPKNLLDIGGYFTSGGMMGNMAALLVARNSIFPDAQKKGIPSFDKPPKIILPYFAAHYSLWNAAGWLGFGEDNVVYVSTRDFKYDIAELQSTISNLRSSGFPIMMVVASVGDSFSMSIENLRAVSSVCREHGIWLHGDGANGANLIFSNKYKHLVRDLPLCDSLTLDPHKSMGLNYPSSIFLCKDVQKFNTVVSHWNIVNRPDSLDLGMITPFLNSRGFDSLRLWIALKLFGLKGFGDIIDNKILATKEIYQAMRVECADRVIFWNVPETLSILFQILPHSVNFLDLDMLNFLETEGLNTYQEKFKQTLQLTQGITLHSFKLPMSVKSGKNDDKGKFATVLALQNGHEKIPKHIIDNLTSFIKSFESK